MSTKNKATLSEVVLFIEKLNSIEYKTAPVGNLIGLSLTLHLIKGTPSKGKFFIIKNFIKRRILPFKLRDAKKPISLGNVSYVFGINNNTSRILDFFKPLTSNFKVEEFCFVGPKRAVLSNREFTFKKLFTENDDGFYTKNWFKTFLPIEKEVLVLLKTFNFSKDLELEIINRLQFTTQLYDDCIEILNNSTIKGIVVDHDRQPFNAAIIEAAKAVGIKNYTFIHGSIYPPYNYVPFVADKIICWGDEHIQHLSSFLNEKQEMKALGNPKLDPVKAENSEQVRAELKINKEDCLIVFGNNPIIKPMRVKVAMDIAKAVRVVNTSTPTKLVFKLHPVEQVSDYEQVISMYPEVLLIKNEFSLNDILSCADFVGIHNSNFAIDALVKGIPILVVDTIPLTPGIGGEMINEKCAFRVVNENDLKEVFENYNSDQADYQAKAKMFISKSSKFLGKEASNAIFEEVRS